MKNYEQIKTIEKNSSFIIQLSRPKKLKDGGFVARGCGKIMSGRSKKTKVY